MWEAIAQQASADLGGVFGTLYQAEQNKLARREEAHNQREMFDKQANFSREMFDRQTELSNTAYQRQMADMKQAGLNPMLAMGKGGGASVPSAGGASASGGGAGAPHPGFQRSSANALQVLQMKRELEAYEANIQQAKATAKEQQEKAKQSEIDTELKRNMAKLETRLINQDMSNFNSYYLYKRQMNALNFAGGVLNQGSGLVAEAIKDVGNHVLAWPDRFKTSVGNAKDWISSKIEANKFFNGDRPKKGTRVR